MTTASPTRPERPETPAAYDPPPPDFRDRVSDEPGARFAPEAGRYHLYVMFGCPWAHRTLIVRALKGLEHAIGVTAVHYHLDEQRGWTFAPDRPEPHHGLATLGDLYRLARPGYKGRVTVPVLWDRRERTIVNNESSEILRMLNGAFDAWADRPGLDLYPLELRPAIDRWNERIQRDVNAGAYRAGFAATQAIYDEAERRYFDALDEIDAHLAEHRYLVGDRPTEADWRLFPTLLRFEWVYHGLFRLDRRRLADYPNLLGYARELYQWPGIAATMNERHTRHGYYGSMRKLNPTGIVPPGAGLDFGAPHGRGDGRSASAGEGRQR